MKLFLDSADVEEIRELAAWGVLDGVTTNPSLIAKRGQALHAVIDAICAVVHGPVSAECNEEQAEAMIQEGRALAALHPNVVVKIPLTPAGLQCVHALNAQGIRTNVTLCFTAAQGLLAARAGASYISPFVGRLEDVGADGMRLVRELAQIFAAHRLPTQVLAASMRHPSHVVEAALAGAHVATVSGKVLRAMVLHPLTDAGLAQFLADTNAAKNARGATTSR